MKQTIKPSELPNNYFSLEGNSKVVTLKAGGKKRARNRVAKTEKSTNKEADTHAQPTQLVQSVQFNLIDNKDRKVLHEGRNYGVGFAFCKRDGNTLTTVQPISPCKDYLNDVIYSEQTGKPYSACGLQTKKEDIFSDGNGYLLFAVCKQCRHQLTEYGNYKLDLKMLNDNLVNLEKFIHEFEEKLKIEGRTKIHKISDNRVVAICPLFWTQYSYLISFYSLLLRSGIHFMGDKSAVDFLFNTTSLNDVYSINTCQKKVDKMFAGEIPKQDFSKFHHGWGICGFNDWSVDTATKIA